MEEATNHFTLEVQDIMNHEFLCYSDFFLICDAVLGLHFIYFVDD